MSNDGIGDKILGFLIFGGLAVALFMVARAVIGPSSEDVAEKYIVQVMQDKQKLFKDQYDTDVVIDNERGAVVVVEIVDEKLVPPDVNRYIMFALTREQSVKSVQ